MDKRTILAFVLSLAVLLTYQMFFAKPPVPRQAAPVQVSNQINRPPLKKNLRRKISR
jgi:YidC/Oxa1 family membrane protein insertase